MCSSRASVNFYQTTPGHTWEETVFFLPLCLHFLFRNSAYISYSTSVREVVEWIHLRSTPGNRNPEFTWIPNFTSLHQICQKLFIVRSHNGADRLCGLVVRVYGCRYRGPGFDSRPYQIFWEIEGLERGPLSLVRTIEELLEWKSSGSGLENRDQRPWKLVALTTQHPLPGKVGTNLPDKRRSLGRSVYFACGLRPRNLVFFFSHSGAHTDNWRSC
jgi:hypothetical protein